MNTDKTATKPLRNEAAVCGLFCTSCSIYIGTKEDKEMLEHYACPQCGTINSAYDMACRKCGNTPSCNYVEANREEIIKRMAGLENIRDGR